MPNDDTHNPPPEANDDAPKPAPLRWLWKFNHGLDVVKGLSMVTVLSSLAVGYFQYLSAYQDKVGSQAKEDMAAATSTFTEISHAFSEMQALQQTLMPISRAPSVRNPMPATRRWSPRMCG